MVESAKKREKKSWLAALIIGIVAVIGIGIGAFLLGRYISPRKAELVAEKSYINYGNGFTYRGKALFSDGSIFEWDFDYDDDIEYTARTKEEQKAWILKNGKRSLNTVSKADLMEIGDNIGRLENEILYEMGALDIGSSKIVVWRGSEEVYIKKGGDTVGENKTEAAQKLITILEEYL